MSAAVSSAKPSLSVWERCFQVLFCILGILALMKLVGRATVPKGDHMIYFAAAKALSSGGDPYTIPGKGASGYLYPPFWAFVLTPLTMLGPIAYAALWAVLLGASWWFARRLIHVLAAMPGAMLPNWIAFAPAVFLLRPIHEAWGRGQVSLLLLFLACLAIFLEREGRWFLAISLIALAGAIKIYPLWLLLLFVAPFRPLCLLAAGLVSLALALSPTLVVGMDRLLFLIQEGLMTTSRVALEHQAVTVVRCAPVPTLWRLAGWEAGTTLQVVQILWLLSVALLAAFTRPSSGNSKHRRIWTAFVVTSMLVVTPALAEDFFVLLLLPVTTSLVLVSDEAPGSTVRRCLLAGLVVFAVLYSVFLPGIIPSELMARPRELGLPAAALTAYWSSLLVALFLIRKR